MQPHAITLNPTLIARFWTYVDKISSPHGCWLWTGSRGRRTYGRFWIAQRIPIPAHRVSYYIQFGPIPDGVWVLHNCPGGDNPSCVNPEHLWLGTDADNIADMHAKGRGGKYGRSGTANHNAKLTEDQVRQIRHEYAAGTTNCVALARKYGVTRTPIKRIVDRKAWKHVI